MSTFFFKLNLGSFHSSFWIRMQESINADQHRRPTPLMLGGEVEAVRGGYHCGVSARGVPEAGASRHGRSG